MNLRRTQTFSFIAISKSSFSLGVNYVFFFFFFLKGNDSFFSYSIKVSYKILNVVS